MTAVGKIPRFPEALRGHPDGARPAAADRLRRARAKATAQAREATDPTPLRVFTETWAVEVTIERDPDAAARLRTLEHKADVATNIAEARDIARRIAAIRRAAAVDAGLLPAAPTGEWAWDYAFAAEDQLSYPKIVQDEVRQTLPPHLL